MTSTFGESSLSVLLDSDAIIASILDDDLLHARSLDMFTKLADKQTTMYVSATTVAETVVGLHRKFNERGRALDFLEKIVNRWAELVIVDDGIMSEAYRILLLSQSKQNTIFDAINIAAVKIHHLDAIFSFDRWYGRHGIRMVEDMLRKGNEYEPL